MTAWEGSDAQYRGEQTKSSEYDRLKVQYDEAKEAAFLAEAKKRGYVPASQFAEAINAIRAVIPDFRSREWRDDYAKREAPEDPEVLALCKKHGFGAVMGSASRQWYRLDPCGAFVVNFAAGMERIMGDKLRKAVGQEDGV